MASISYYVLGLHLVKEMLFLKVMPILEYNLFLQLQL